jgi:hypothetical protein
MPGPSVPSITCPVCHLTSYSAGDIEHRYCGNCHMYHADMEGSTDAKPVRPRGTAEGAGRP